MIVKFYTVTNRFHNQIVVEKSGVSIYIQYVLAMLVGRLTQIAGNTTAAVD